jgi:hypothetical protein
VPFDRQTRQQVDSYARGDLDGDVDDHIAFFSFLADDPGLQRRVGEEYFAARYIYKLFEGLRIVDEWGRRAQIQLQVQQYASIYEACIHYLLFAHASDSLQVQELLRIQTLKHYSVDPKLEGRLSEIQAPNGRRVVAAVEAEIRLSEIKVRFDSKTRAAVALGIIDEALGDELIEFYTARNMIHIHAELRKGVVWAWEIEFARQAYWRLERFRDQAVKWRSRGTNEPTDR